MRLMEMGQSASSAQDMVTLTRLCLTSERQSSPEWIKAKQIVSPRRLAVPVQKFLRIAQIGFHEAPHVAKMHSRAP